MIAQGCLDAVERILRALQNNVETILREREESFRRT